MPNRVVDNEETVMRLSIPLERNWKRRILPQYIVGPSPKLNAQSAIDPKSKGNDDLKIEEIGRTRN